MSDKYVEITLADALTIDGKQVKELIFTREPIGRDFGQFTVMDLLDGNVRAFARIVPKICQPYIDRNTVNAMSSSNLMALQNGFGAFFERLELDTMASLKTTATTPTNPVPAKMAATSSGSSPKA